MKMPRETTKKATYIERLANQVAALHLQLQDCVKLAQDIRAERDFHRERHAGALVTIEQQQKEVVSLCQKLHQAEHTYPVETITVPRKL